MLSVLVPLGLAILWAGPVSASTSAAEDLRTIRSLELDPERCYRVRDVFLEREDIKLYFTDGHVIFARPVLGRDVAALFVATGQTDVGEVLIIPPTPEERESLARRHGETILSEKFRNAMLLFTDDTAAELEAAIRESPSHRPDPEEGARIAPRWSVVVRNLVEGSVSRVLLDLYSGRDGEDGFFAAAIRGANLGRFDVVVDRSLPEQVVAGQLVRADGREFYEVWTRFSARSYRTGQRGPYVQPGHLEDFRIDTRLRTDLHMAVRVEATLVLADPIPRALAFDLSERLEVTSVRVDGEDVEFLQERKRTPDRGGDNAPLIVTLPAGLTEDEPVAVEFEYQGKIVADAGPGVYYVANRQNWYPRLGFDKARYQLKFSHPQNLELVATGKLVDERAGDGMRFSEFVSDKPIRLAAFNVGEFASSRRDVDGYQIEVRASRNLEQSLQPTRAPMLIPPSPLPGRRRRQVDQPVLVMPAPPTESPAEDIERIADESADAFRYFLQRFGEPSMPVTVISPVPSDFGQGFPGLVYASTLSYYERGDRVLKRMDPDVQRFYADLLRPHEIAHQWWGNVVTTILDRDAWIMEALATYSSLLWLEESHGVAERNRALRDFRLNLLRKSEGETVESTGPIVLGRRLRTSRLPDAYRIIVYEKGAWIIHMLRGILGDDGFFRMLRKLCDEYTDDPLTTEKFRLLAAEFVPEDYYDPQLRDFFDQWIRGTGIPRLSADWKQTASGGRREFRLRLDQDQVPDGFTVSVPVEVHTLPGRSLVKTVVSGLDEESAFTVTLRNPASRVVIDPESWVLADVR